jgi:isopentenyl-diphosphate Delta-isomerase
MTTLARRASATLARKDDHLRLAASGRHAPPADSLLGCVHFVHEALPELDARAVETRTTFLGKELRLPVLISAMTGGTENGRLVNLDLARAAEASGCAFGLGSQRPMLELRASRRGFALRRVAPTTVIIGNLGLRQALELGPARTRQLMEEVGADAIAVHLNAAQELVQPEGDRDFRGGLLAVEKLARELGDRLLVKETGCGLSPSTVRRLVEVGVRHLDVAGAGGTSFTRIEAFRVEGDERRLGLEFAGWGIPTAACVKAARSVVGERATVIASGGIRSGLDTARAIALGADLVGMALPFLRAQRRGGEAAVRAELAHVGRGLRLAMALTGSSTLARLRTAARHIDPPLADWCSALEDEARFRRRAPGRHS